MMITEETVRKWYNEQERYVVTSRGRGRLESEVHDSKLYTVEPVFSVWDTKGHLKMIETTTYGHAMAWLYANVHGLTLFLNKGVDCYV